MPRASASSWCLPCSPSKWHASGEEDEEVVDVPHELTNVPYHSETALSLCPKPTEQQPEEKEAEPSETHPVGTDTGVEAQKQQEDDVATVSASSTRAQRHSAPPSLQGTPQNPQIPTGRLSYLGPPPYPPPDRQLPAVPARDPARVLAEQRRQLLQRQQRRYELRDDIHDLVHGHATGAYQPCRQRHH